MKIAREFWFVVPILLLNVLLARSALAGDQVDGRAAFLDGEWTAPGRFSWARILETDHEL